MITIVGIDEVGRGCWAGPLVAAAVMLHRPIVGLKDSKQLTKQRRVTLSEIIRKSSSHGIGSVSPAEIDRYGLTKANQLAIQRALEGLDQNYDRIIIDGNINFLPDNPKAEAIIKADQSIAEVSAASILAKVYRDQYMTTISAEYPEYSFDKHVGYGTAEHRQAIKLYGICQLHRRSFKPIRELAA